MNRRYVSPGSSLHTAPARLVEALARLRNRKPSCSAWRMWKRPVTARPPSSISSRRSSPGKDETRNPVQDVLHASDDPCPDPNLVWVWQIALLAFGDPPRPRPRCRADRQQAVIYHPVGVVAHGADPDGRTRVSIDSRVEPGRAVSRGSIWARRAIHRVLGVCAVNRRHSRDCGAIRKECLLSGVLRLECLVLELGPVAASLESTVWLGAGQVLVVAAFDRGTANRAYGGWRGLWFAPSLQKASARKSGVASAVPWKFIRPQRPAVLLNRERASAHRLGPYHMKVAVAICPGNFQENLKTRPEGGLETSEFENVKAAGEARKPGGRCRFRPERSHPESGTRVLGWKRRD